MKINIALKEYFKKVDDIYKKYKNLLKKKKIKTQMIINY